MMGSDTKDVSVVFPCLNEERTIAVCVRAARDAMAGAGLDGEVIVADNGSSDGSREAALAAGARVVDVRPLGYGSALLAGLRAAEGRYLIFLDADLSYDAAYVPRFVEALRDGADLVMGSRFRGAIDKGAMPELHRLLGTPALTKLANVLFGCRISDINCGMRGLTRETFERLDLHSEGMEFASEMVIKAARSNLRIEEIPIDFHADGRDRAPHLRSFRDGWRHLQLILHYCSPWVFWIPALLLLAAAAALIAVCPVSLLTALSAQCVVASGILVFLLGIIAQGRVTASKFLPWRNTRLHRFARNWVKLEQGILIGAATALAGMAIAGIAAFSAGQGPALLAQGWKARMAMAGAAVFICGLETFFASVFMGLFGIRVAENAPETHSRPPNETRRTP